jgi:hypothetical protein
VAKRTATKRKTPKPARPAATLNDLFEAAPPIDDRAIGADDASLHDLFQRQTMDMLDRSDLSEEQKQSILVAMNCPCCGGSGLSFTMKLKRKK